MLRVLYPHAIPMASFLIPCAIILPHISSLRVLAADGTADGTTDAAEHAADGAAQHAGHKQPREMGHLLAC